MHSIATLERAEVSSAGQSPHRSEAAGLSHALPTHIQKAWLAEVHAWTAHTLLQVGREMSYTGKCLVTTIQQVGKGQGPGSALPKTAHHYSRRVTRSPQLGLNVHCPYKEWFSEILMGKSRYTLWEKTESCSWYLTHTVCYASGVLSQLNHTTHLPPAWGCSGRRAQWDLPMLRGTRSSSTSWA